MHYNPETDPKVVNGVQEAYGFKVGDIVEYTNVNGVTFSPRKVIGFVPEIDSGLPDRVVYINTDCPWMPVKVDQLKKIREA